MKWIFLFSTVFVHQTQTSMEPSHSHYLCSSNSWTKMKASDLSLCPPNSSLNSCMSFIAQVRPVSLTHLLRMGDKLVPSVQLIGSLSLNQNKQTKKPCSNHCSMNFFCCCWQQLTCLYFLIWSTQTLFLEKRELSPLSFRFGPSRKCESPPHTPE